MNVVDRKLGLSFAVRLTPRGGRDSVDGWDKDDSGRAYLKARVRAAAEDGKANAALIALIATHLDVPRSAVSIASGAKARLKMVTVSGDKAVLRGRLDHEGTIN
jgi:hypothetical protein